MKALAALGCISTQLGGAGRSVSMATSLREALFIRKSRNEGSEATAQAMQYPCHRRMRTGSDAQRSYSPDWPDRISLSSGRTLFPGRGFRQYARPALPRFPRSNAVGA